MEFEQMQIRARGLRSLFNARETERFGSPWNATDLTMGLVGDVGDLAKLVAAADGRRDAPDDLQEDLGHELADCLWSVMVIADELGIDMERAFTSTVDRLEARLTPE